MPRLRGSIPRARVFGKGFRPVVHWIKSDGKQDQVATNSILKSFLQIAEIIRTTKTEIRQRATGIDEVKGDDPTDEIRKNYWSAVLIDKCEVGYLVPDGQELRSVHGASMEEV